MKKLFPHTVASLALALSLTSLSVPFAAQAETVSEALHLVNISARQRMLAQRMAGLSCLVHLDIEPEIYAAEALEARDVFRNSLDALRSGNEASSAEQATKAKVETSINLAQDQYNLMSGYLNSLQTVGTVGPNRLAFIASTSNDLFEVSEDLTNYVQIAERQKLENLPLIRTMILNFSGRQRMLSEKAFKEFCLAQSGINAAENIESLVETTSIFDTTMNALINGMPGLIIAPPTTEIKAKLEEARNVWLPVKDVLERAISGEQFDTHAIHKATEDLETVRMLMDEAVTLYQNYSDTSS